MNRTGDARPRRKWGGFEPTHLKHRAGAVLGLALAATMLGSLSCDRSGSKTGGCPAVEPGSPPIDEGVMAFLSAARALHHEADIRERSGDVEGAVRLLERLAALRAPKASETGEVLADAYARLAELHLEKNDVDAADRDVHEGLDLAQGSSYFRGHLLEVAGIVEQRRAGALADAGSAREAAETRARAASLFEEAVHVQEQVIARALADGGENE